MKKLALLLSVAGIADSAYLLLLEVLPECPIGTCASISIFNLPTYLPALLGLAWFLLSILIFTANSSRLLLQLWRFSGVAGAAFLGSYAVLHSYFCPFCFTAYLIGVVLVAISEKMLG